VVASPQDAFLVVSEGTLRWAGVNDLDVGRSVGETTLAV